MKQNFFYSKFFILTMVAFLLIPVFSFARSFSDSEKGILRSEKKMLNKNSKEYKSRILEINENLLKLKMNTEWLLLKILRLEDQNQVVPYNIEKARQNNEDKKESYDNEKKRLERLIAEHKKTIASIDRKLYGPLKNKSSVKKKSVKKGSIKTATKSNSGKLSSLQKKLEKKIVSAGLKNWVKLSKDGSRLKLDVILPILFASGKTNISKEYKKFFGKFARFIKPYPVRIEVAGFTDKSRVKNKKFTSNFEIGANRAASVVQQLIKDGLDPSIFEVISRGEYGLSSSKSGNNKAKALSRRAEITVYFKNV